MSDWIKVGIVLMGCVGVGFLFFCVSATVCRMAIRRLQIHERALTAFYDVYHSEDVMDRLDRQKSRREREA